MAARSNTSTPKGADNDDLDGLVRFWRSRFDAFISSSWNSPCVFGCQDPTLDVIGRNTGLVNQTSVTSPGAGASVRATKTVLKSSASLPLESRPCQRH